MFFIFDAIFISLSHQKGVWINVLCLILFIVFWQIPMASTCFNMLKLTSYSSEKHLKDKLLVAIRHGAEGFWFAWALHPALQNVIRGNEISTSVGSASITNWQRSVCTALPWSSCFHELQIQLSRTWSKRRRFQKERWFPFTCEQIVNW